MNIYESNSLLSDPRSGALPVMARYESSAYAPAAAPEAQAKFDAAPGRWGEAPQPAETEAVPATVEKDEKAIYKMVAADRERFVQMGERPLGFAVGHCAAVRAGVEFNGADY